MRTETGKIPSLHPCPYVAASTLGQKQKRDNHYLEIKNRQKFAHITKKDYLCTAKSGCSAVGSALRSGRRGRAFESPHPDFFKTKGIG